MPTSSLGREIPSALTERIVCLLARYPTIKLGILFGSLAEGRMTPESDLDLGVAATVPLDTVLKTALIEALGEISGRPVDLVDLQVVHGPILQQVLTQGTLIYCTDRTLYAALIRTMLFNQSDMMPYLSPQARRLSRLRASDCVPSGPGKSPPMRLVRPRPHASV